MSGADPATIRTTLEKRHTRSELKEMLGEELGATYPQEVTQSLRNDLMEAFFRTVGVDPSEVDLPFETTTYDDLRDPSIKSYYGPEHALVTALNHYLANRGIRERDSVDSLSKSVMASMIADIQVREQETGCQTHQQESDSQIQEQESDSQAKQQEPDPQGREQASAPQVRQQGPDTPNVATPLSVAAITDPDFTSAMQDVEGFAPDAGAYIYVLRLHRTSDGSEWYYIGQATGGVAGLETRLRSHLRDPTNIQRTVVRDGREILARKVERSHEVVGIERIEPLNTKEIRTDRAESHEHGYLNPEKYTNFYINEAERRIAYEVAIEKGTTNVLGGK